MTTSRRKLTPREAWICLGKGLLLFVLIPWAAWAAADEIADYRLTRALEELQADGFATCIGELLPPEIPPEENAARFYSAAFAAFDIIDRPCLISADAFSSTTADEKAELLNAIDQSADVVGLLRRARSLRKCRFDRDYRKELSIPIPECASAMHLSRLLILRAQTQAEAGRQEDARESVRDLLALAECFRDEPVFELQFTRSILVDQAVITIEQCSRSAGAEADLLAWLRLLPSPSTWDEALERGLRAELASTACLLTKSRKMDSLLREPEGFSRVLDPIVTLLGLETLDRMRTAVALCGRRNAEAHAIATAMIDRSEPVTMNFNILRFLERPIRSLLDQRAVRKARLALAQAGLEAELFFVRHGHYPTETEVRDEITGEPFVIDLGEGVIRAAGPGLMDPERLKVENLEWTLLPR
jgi:hypothetical protein